jgi:hypothetical protein
VQRFPRSESQGYTTLRPKGASNRALIWVAVWAIVLLGLLIHRTKDSATPSVAGHDQKVARPAEGAPAARPTPETPRRPQEHRSTDRLSPVLPPIGQRVVKCQSRTGAATYSDTHCAAGSRSTEIQLTPDVNLADGMSTEDRLASLRENQALARATLEHELRMAQGQIDGSDSKCESLASLIVSLDAQARRPQSAHMQDWIKGQRRHARDRQFALRCQ